MSGIQQAVFQNQRSFGPPLDAQFNYVTMLLHGDGTNGAQNNTFIDSSSNAFSITRNGNTTQGSFSPYGANWSNFFSYNATAVNYLVSSSVSLSGTFTIEGYVYWDGVGSNANMFTLGDSILSTGMEIYISSGNWVFWADNSTRITGSAAVVGQWTYISVTRTGTTVTMYINGVSQGTWTSSATFSGTIKVGGEFYGSTFYSSMSGYISNFRVNNTTAINAVPTVPLTAVSGTIFLTCQSNRFIDNSASPLTITVNGTPSVQRFNPFGTSTAYDTSVIGGSGYFDGNNDYLTIANTTALDLPADFTIEFWVYLNSTSDMSFVGKWNTSNFSWIAQLNGGAVRFYSGSGSSLGSGSTFAWNPVIKTWYHVAVTRSGTSLRAFINGIQVGATFTETSNLTSTASTGIGVNLDGTNYQPTDGYISDIRVVKGTALYTSAFTPPTSPLTAITNTSLLTNFTNGAIFDNVMMNDLETVGNAQISTSVKKYGTGSIAFDGTGDYLVSNAASSDLYAFGTGDFTIEFWLYLNSMSGLQVFYDGRPTSAEGLQPTIYTNSSGTLFYYTTGNRITFNSLSTNTWYHIAVSRSGSSTKMFVDGTQVGSTYTDTTNYVNPASRPVIGADGYVLGTNAMNGYLDDYRITKGYARYTANFTPPSAAFLNIGPN